MEEQALLEKILGELEANKKSRWDEKLKAISVFLSTVVLAVVGLILDSRYNERQIQRESEDRKNQVEIQKLETIRKLIPDLTGSEQQKEIALDIVSALGYPDFVIRYAVRSQTSGVLAAADKTMRIGEPEPSDEAAARESATATETGITQPQQVSQTKTGWAYVGQYDSSSDTWKTRYFQFDSNLKPKALLGLNSLSVREKTGSLNVREGMPTLLGSMRPVIDVLEPNTKVHFLTVKEWFSSGYIWAEIKYTEG